MEPPKTQLNSLVRNGKLENGTKAKVFSSSEYVRAVVSIIKENLGKVIKKFPSRAETPICACYRHKLDMSPKLHP